MQRTVDAARAARPDLYLRETLFVNQLEGMIVIGLAIALRYSGQTNSG
jgi:hypothetical protein